MPIQVKKLKTEKLQSLTDLERAIRRADSKATAEKIKAGDEGGLTPAPPDSFREFCTLGSRLTDGQIVFNEVAYDGVDPVDLPLKYRELSYKIWGDAKRMDRRARRIVVQVKGRGVAGTRNAAERCAHLGLTMDLEARGIEKKELCYVFFGAPRYDLSLPGFTFAKEALLQAGARLINQNANGFTLIRHDGYRVRFERRAATAGGDGFRAVHIIATLLDEAAFYRDEKTGAVNGEEILSACTPRLLKGGQILIISSPWAEAGILYDLYELNYGKPSNGIAAKCPTWLMRHGEDIDDMVRSERERDPLKAQRELDAEFMAIGSGLYFDRHALSLCVDAELPLIIPANSHKGWRLYGGYDPAYVSDAAAGVIVRTNGERFEVVEVFLAIAHRGKPLIPSETDIQFGERMRAHGVRVYATDLHCQESVREHIDGRGVYMFDGIPGGNAGKCAQFAALKEAINSKLLTWSKGHSILTKQAGEITSRPLAGGLTQISSPRRKGEHGDIVHALALAMWLATDGGSGIRSLEFLSLLGNEHFGSVSRFGEIDTRTIGDGTIKGVGTSEDLERLMNSVEGPQTDSFGGTFDGVNEYW